MIKEIASLVATAVFLLPLLSCGIGGGAPQEPSPVPAKATDVPAQPTSPPAEATPAETPTLAAQQPAESPTLPPPTSEVVATSPGAIPGEQERQWAVSATASSEYGSPRWAAQQATGEPDTLECGDFDTAWASETASGFDWLEVGFARAVIPDEIQIYETHAPGSIVQVDVIDAGGTSRTVWQGQPQAVDVCPRVFRVPVSGVDVPVSRVRITLDQRVAQDWNEIDAVQLIGRSQPGAAAATPVPTLAPAAGSPIAQWAAQATASSEYDNPQWSAQQATGRPDTAECGDYPTAWAAQGASERAWLEVSYTTPVRPTEIVIHESYNPGSIVRVEVIDTAGTARTVWEGTPGAVETCPRAFRVPVAGIDQLISRVRITLDQSIIQDWNEIDAVQLVGLP